MEITFSARVQEWVESYANSQGKTIEQVVNTILETDLAESLTLHGWLIQKKRQPPAHWLDRVNAVGTLVEADQQRRRQKTDARESRREKYIAAQLRKIDYSALEKANNKAGYAGVYANGEGWRAHVMLGGKGKHLPTRTQPELAAWDRYLFFQEHDLPYGDHAKVIEQTLRGPQAGSDPLLIEAAHEALESWSAGKIPTFDIDGVYAEKKARRALLEAEAPKQKMGRPPKKLPIYADKAGRLTWVDNLRIVIEHDDGTATSYLGLGEVVPEKFDHIELNALLGYLIGAKAKLTTKPVPPPSKIIRESVNAPLPVHYGPLSPHYAEKMVWDGKPKKPISIVEEYLKEAVPALPPEAPVEAVLEAPVEAIPAPEPVVEPVPQERSIFALPPPSTPPRGRFANIKAKPQSREVIEQSLAEIAELPFPEE